MLRLILCCCLLVTVFAGGYRTSNRNKEDAPDKQGSGKRGKDEQVVMHWCAGPLGCIPCIVEGDRQVLAFGVALPREKRYECPYGVELHPRHVDCTVKEDCYPSSVSVESTEEDSDNTNESESGDTDSTAESTESDDTDSTEESTESETVETESEEVRQ